MEGTRKQTRAELEVMEKRGPKEVKESLGSPRLEPTSKNLMYLICLDVYLLPWITCLLGNGAGPGNKTAENLCGNPAILLPL